MDLVLKSIKPADYPFLLEMAKRLRIQTETIGEDCVYLPDHVVAGVKKSLKEVDKGQILPYNGMRKMLGG